MEDCIPVQHFVENITSQWTNTNVTSSTEIVMSYAEQSHSPELEHVLNRYVIPGICGFGAIGNLLNLVILTRNGLASNMERMQRSAHYGLVALALSDLLFCLSVLPHAWVDKTVFSFKHRSFALYYATYEHAFINIFIMASTWLTVAMATSRYLAICHPLRAREIIGMKFTKISLVMVFIFCIIFNLPRFWTNSIEYMECQNGQREYYNNFGALKLNHLAEQVYLWCYFFIGILIPLLILAVCNFNLILALRQSLSMRKQYQDSTVIARSNKHRITLTFVIIVIAYFLLVLPSELINFTKSLLAQNKTEDHGIGMANVAVAICNTLQVINFSFNFVLYCVVNVNFRNTFMSTFCRCLVKPKTRPSRRSTYTSIISCRKFSESSIKDVRLKNIQPE